MIAVVRVAVIISKNLSIFMLVYLKGVLVMLVVRVTVMIRKTF